MKTSLFDYALPKELIAFHPPKNRDGGRLLTLSLDKGTLDHRAIVDLPLCLPHGTLLVANDTRVIKARLRGRRPTGGKIEVLLVREMATTDPTRCAWTALLRANKPVRVGDQIELDDIRTHVTHVHGQGEVILGMDASLGTLREYISAKGEVPLPPYIKRAPVPEDVERYQTVFAKHDGSVAAPTAGLHFTETLKDQLKSDGIETLTVTLHVGPGTFRPVKATDITKHKMDSEEYHLEEEAVTKIIQAKQEGRRVVAIGTTVTRALEGAYAAHGELKAGSGFTNIFITPGFSFNVIDGLLTNFHLPASTLLCLVSALAGRERVLKAYETAVKMKYRFYSYGDAMLML